MKRLNYFLVVLAMIPISVIAAEKSLENVDLKKEAQQFYAKTQRLISRTDNAINEYNNGNSTFLVAINKDMSTLVSKSEELFGPASDLASPFHGCLKMGTFAQFYWQEKIFKSSSANVATLDNAKKMYEEARKECKDDIIHPTSNKKDDLAIIDIDAPH